MSNRIAIELCAEDRARLDRLAEALERRTCDKCVSAAIEYVKAPVAPTEEAPQQESATEEAPPGDDQKAPSAAQTVSRAELRAKVIELSAKGLKEQTRDIVKAYAPTVKDLPDNKLVECYEKLAALDIS